MTHIFISYSSMEFEYADTVAQGIVDAGYLIWMDKRNGILPGDDWQDKLQEGVNNSAAMIVLLSRNYVESEWCKREYRRAYKLGIPILVAKIGDVKPEDIPMQFEDIQYVDFVGIDIDSASFQERISELVVGLQNQGISSVKDTALPKLVCGAKVSCVV